MSQPTTNRPLCGISSMATRLFLADVVADWQARGGAEVRFESVGGADAAKRVQAGEAFDIVVLSADAIAKLEAAGRVVASSECPLVNSSVAIAVKRGAPHPDLSTEVALRAALLAARSVGYSTGPSGVALARLFAGWDIAREIESRLVQAPPGVPVGELLVRGDVELGFQQLSELLPIDGVEVVAGMPPGLAIDTLFSGAICSGSTRAEAARAFLEFARSPAMDGARRRHGLQSA